MSALAELSTQRRFLADATHVYVNRTPLSRGEACVAYRQTGPVRCIGLTKSAVALLREVIGRSPVLWNDRESPTREMALAKLDAAIALAKERGL